MLHFCVFEAVFVNYLSSPFFDWRNPISIEKSSLVSRYTSNSSNNNYIRPCDKEEKEIVLFFFSKNTKSFEALVLFDRWNFLFVLTNKFCVNKIILLLLDW